ncbi:methyltransferase domain-containing protein [Mariniflexile litorale]|uniref:Methyltransferase domain-containing protein n=1 Tax=Mariniflexile litorale TaxID=3045158 RepID=A0AAU7ECH5_9FLAO|nr:methyltransferase domain-containing protein [Mariniflexile sp. KMM 9835]MDQ8212200.1 methyltransferase domain-containing protein [Mariniflexile sp. KMM 9835]
MNMTIDSIFHPDTHSKLIEITETNYLFEDGATLPVHDGVPILFGSDSIFCADDIINNKATTQSSAYLNTSTAKNYIRRKLLPSLCADFNIEKRYHRLVELCPKNGKVLVVGAGEKIDYYKNLFKNCEVITSDVHNQFKPDYVFDGHFIPFVNNTFDIVLAAQVIEHTINPWKFCQELQRITKLSGVLQIEAPHNFPYHAEPYDFYRFTYTGMRSLFPGCEVLKAEITEGNASVVAITLSNYFVNLSSKKLIRSGLLFVTRILFGWLKYLDQRNVTPNRRTVSMPKGYAFTFKKDNIKRTSRELLKEFYTLKK